MVSHPNAVNPFPYAFLNFRSQFQLRKITLTNETFMEWDGSFDTELTVRPTLCLPEMLLFTERQAYSCAARPRHTAQQLQECTAGSSRARCLHNQRSTIVQFLVQSDSAWWLVQGVVDMERAIKAQFVGGIRGLQKTFARPPSIGLAPPKRSITKPMIGATDTGSRYRSQVGLLPRHRAWLCTSAELRPAWLCCPASM